MKCHVPSPNVKVFGRTIHALARFGDELYLESLPDCIVLRTLNSSESAYAIVKFNKTFFSYFNYNYYTADDSEGFKCKISMKSALNAFKSPTHMDKQVENLEIKLDPEASKLIFQLRCKHGIVKTYFVAILDCKAIMQAIYTKDLVPNRISAHQRIFSEALSNFQHSDDQVTFEVSSQSLILRNYIDLSTDLKIIRTQINLKPSEFDSYSIGTDTLITFALKEFRALLAFAEALNLPLQVHFETTGRPAVFIVHNGSTLEAHFVLATSKADNATQGTMSTQNSRVERNKRKDTTSCDVSRKKPHLDVDVDKCLEEDSHLFNFIDIPDENISRNVEHNCPEKKSDNIEIDCDNIPGSPTSKIKIQSVFRRCFESTFDPRSIKRSILAENSDSE